MKRRIRLLVALYLALSLLTLPAAAGVRRQEVTPAPLRLIAGETVTGRMSSADAPLSYSIALPRGHDAVFELNADGTFVTTVCLRYQMTNGAGGSSCNSFGALGDDPISLVELVSSFDRSEGGEVAEITLSRSAARVAAFNLTAYVIAPWVVNVGDGVSVQPNTPFQTYSLRAEDDVAFTVQVEDDEADGRFLWAAHLPIRLIDFNRSTSLGPPTSVDGAAINGDGDGVQRLRLFYLGEETYRVVVRATDDYTFKSTLATDEALPAGETRVMTASFRDPVRIIPLMLDDAQRAEVEFRLLDGAGAFVVAQRAGAPIGESKALGRGSRGDVVFPLEASISVPLGDDTAAYVTVQIPVKFTRDSVQVEVRWTPVAGT
jgi:hypothetical protein